LGSYLDLDGFFYVEFCEAVSAAEVAVEAVGRIQIVAVASAFNDVHWY